MKVAICLFGNVGIPKDASDRSGSNIVEESKNAESMVSQFNHFDKNPSREKNSIYVEANKPKIFSKNFLN